MTCVLALISRMLSARERLRPVVHRPALGVDPAPSQHASQCAGFCERIARIFSVRAGMAGRQRSPAIGRASSDAGGSHGWCGSGKLIQTNQSSAASSESSNSIVRSATQSVWYHSRGIGLFAVSGAPVSPPPSAFEQRREAVHVLGVRPAEPAAVVPDRALAERGMCVAWIGALEAPPRAEVVARLARVLLEAQRRIEVRLEVRLAEQRGAVAGILAQVRGDARRVDGSATPLAIRRACARTGP